MNNDWSLFFQQLWNFTLSIINFISSLWEWLVSPLTIGFNISRIDDSAFGFLINWAIDLLNSFSISLTPIVLFSGTTIFVLLGLYLVKTFIPLA